MTKPVPEGMHTVTPVLSVEGAADAIEFYKKAFGAVELGRFTDPSGKKIMHASVRIGDSVLFIGDAMPEMGGPGAYKTRIWLYVDQCDAAFKRATDAGCQTGMPPADMFWGDRMAQCIDRWGNSWTIATHTKDMTPEEMKKGQEAFMAQMKKK
jgi:uncharacterized glyoxalase superfamily protein PhnB